MFFRRSLRSSVPAPAPLPSERELAARRSRAWQLLSQITPVLRQARDGTLPVTMATACGDIVESFIESGWPAWDAEHRLGVSRLLERDRRVVEATINSATAHMALALQPAAGSAPREASPNGPVRRVTRAIHMLGERLLAAHMAREPEHNIDHMARVLESLAYAAHLAACSAEAAHHLRLPPRDTAPAFWSALLHWTHPETNPTPTSALTRHRFADGSPYALPLHEAWATEFARDLNRADEIIPPVFALGRQLGRELARPHAEPGSGHPDWERLPGSLQRILRHEAPTMAPAKVRVGEILKYAAAAHGDNPAAWVEGGCDVLDMIMTTAMLRRHAAVRRAAAAGNSAPPNARLSRLEMLQWDVAPVWLPRLHAIAEGERVVAADAERRWREIEAEVRKLAERARFDEHAPQQYVFPETMSEVEARALYYFDATRQGLPLGLFLHELEHDADLKFGPSESLFFSRVMFAGARRFAATLAANEDPRITALAATAESDRVRIEHVRTVLAGIERQLRLMPSATPAHDLKTAGEAQFQDAVGRGDLRRVEASALWADYPGTDATATGAIGGTIIDAMVARIIAQREIDLLTGLLVVEGKVPGEYVAAATDLPYVAHVARHPGPQYVMRRLVARNGQTMDELEHITRARWLQYRLDAPPGIDVRPIDIGAPDEENGTIHNPLNLRGRKPFQRRTWTDDNAAPKRRDGGSGAPRRGPGRS